MGRGDKGKLGFLFGPYSCPRWAVTITEHAGSGEHQELGDRHLCSELGVGWGIESSVKVFLGASTEALGAAAPGQLRFGCISFLLERSTSGTELRASSTGLQRATPRKRLLLPLLLFYTSLFPLKADLDIQGSLLCFGSKSWTRRWRVGKHPLWFILQFQQVPRLTHSHQRRM